MERGEVKFKFRQVIIICIGIKAVHINAVKSLCLGYPQGQHPNDPRRCFVQSQQFSIFATENALWYHMLYAHKYPVCLTLNRSQAHLQPDSFKKWLKIHNM